MDTQKPEESANLRFEYAQAQSMLEHYDRLNWQIGSVLIGSIFLMSGFVLSSSAVGILTGPNFVAAMIMSFGIPYISFVILGLWILWFKRHKKLYDLRNETMHRIEEKLGMFHFLRCVFADKKFKKGTRNHKRLMKARERAGYSETGFKPFYHHGSLPKPSGFNIARTLMIIIPVLQAMLFLLIVIFG